MAASAAASDSSTHPSITITRVGQSGVEAGKATITSVGDAGQRVFEAAVAVGALGLERVAVGPK
jgi:hypothetical protein